MRKSIILVDKHVTSTKLKDTFARIIWGQSAKVFFKRHARDPDTERIFA